MSPVTIQSDAYFEGYATALMQEVENQTPDSDILRNRDQVLYEAYKAKLEQHGLGLHWLEFFGLEKGE
jgi:hypothetical protein